jgi:cysteinyl-tRNA synthetase
LLGLDLDRVLATKPAGADAVQVDALMDILIRTRQLARESKAWPIADFIRDALKQAGYALEDRPQGTTWKKE